MTLLIYVVSFIVLALAAREIGHFLGKAFKLPHITGYLFAGLLFGPFVLGLLPKEATTELRFIDELSLAVIAFVAGSELYLKELKGRFRPILLNTFGVMFAALLMGGIAMFLLTEAIPFTQGLPTMARVAVAVLGATVLLALSPASTIAVIQEVRARGPFTKTTLSTTVVMDVVIIVLFAVSTAIAGALLNAETGSLDLGFIPLVLLDIGVALVGGYLIGQVIAFILSTRLSRRWKTAFVLLIGMGVFVVSFEVTNYTKANWPIEVHLEPLLTAMIAGFVITNFTKHRDEFAEILHDVAPAVYVAFFTLTGIALKLDILLTTGLIAVLLFGVRVFSIFVGSYIGGTLAGEPPRFRRIAWMGLITQAGIALGLAREVAVEFPNTLGDAFATLIISVVVLNEIFGPLFLKFALRQAGETHLPEDIGEKVPTRDALILGVEGQSLALARRLQRNGWNVIIADTDPSHLEQLAAEDVDERHLHAISPEGLSHLVTNNTDALVAMLPDDAANLAACQIAYENFGVKRMVARLNDLSWADQFKALGVQVMDSGSAMLNLLDQTVRAPQSVALLMHVDPEYDIRQITVTVQDMDGVLLRDLRLPPDVLVLEITRNGHSVVPNGATRIHLQDEVTIVGGPASLDRVTLKLGY